MPLTATWQTVPVFGTWRNYDGTLRAGAYKVNLLVRVVNDNAGVKTIFSKGQFAAGALNTSNNSLPSFTVDVPATDDPQNTPTGFQLVVEVDLGLDPFAADAPTETFVIDVPLSALPTGINLADVVLPDTIPIPAPGLTKGVAGGIAGLDSDGDVVDADGTKILAGGGGGGGSVAWVDITGKPTTFAPSAHEHPVADIDATGTPSGTTFLRGDGTWSVPPGGSITASQITDSTTVGRAVVTATDAAAARTAIGAGTGNSNLGLGTSSITAAAGDDARLSDERTPTDASVTNAKIAPAAGIALSKLATDPLDRVNHTGAQLASTISDSTVTGRAVLAASDAAAARTAIGATNLAIGTTGSTAKAGNWTPTLADQPSGYVHKIVQVTDNVIPARGSARTDIYVEWQCWDDPDTAALANDVWHVVSQP